MSRNQLSTVFREAAAWMRDNNAGRYDAIDALRHTVPPDSGPWPAIPMDMLDLYEDACARVIADCYSRGLSLAQCSPVALELLEGLALRAMLEEQAASR